MKHNKISPSEEDVTRFNKRVQKSAGCWRWIGAEDKDGYGFFEIKGVKLRAPRVSFAIHCGDMPDHFLVCHSCDNPGCVNPSHLFLGTPLDNMRDKVAKGRLRFKTPPPESAPKGSQNGLSKLTEEIVLQIRSEHEAGGVMHKDLARKFNVSRSNVTVILNRKSWTHV